MSYTTITEEIYSLSYSDKLELKTLLEKYLIEDRRKEILAQHQDAIKMASDGDLFFSKIIKTENIEQQIERQLREHKNRNQLSEIIGKWPGDESFEELLTILTK